MKTNKIVIVYMSDVAIAFYLNGELKRTSLIDDKFLLDFLPQCMPYVHDSRFIEDEWASENEFHSFSVPNLLSEIPFDAFYGQNYWTIKEPFHFEYYKDEMHKYPKYYKSMGNGIYLHGKMEDEAGYDISYASSNFKNVDDGIYPATFNGKDGGTLFLSRRQFDSAHIQLRGLVVWNNDPEFDSVKKDFLNGKGFFETHKYQRPAIFVNID